MKGLSGADRPVVRAGGVHIYRGFGGEPGRELFRLGGIAWAVEEAST